MTRNTPRNMAASVRDRLMNCAEQSGEAFDLVLIRYALERLLYRVAQSPFRERFVVKGAILFQVWSKHTHRPTRDLDLLGSGKPSIEEFSKIFGSLCEQSVTDDGLMFVADSVSVSKMKEDEEYEGLRVKFEARLGSARIPIQVDIGFGDVITPPAIDTATLKEILDAASPNSEY